STAMHAESRAPAVFNRFGVLQGIDMLIIPANPHLDRYRLANSPNNLGYHLLDLPGVKQPTGTRITLGNLGNRAAHINIDDIRIRILIDVLSRAHKRLG